MPAPEYYTPAVQILTCQVTALGRFWVSLNFAAPYWRLYWNPESGASVIFAGREAKLDPAQILIIPPDTAFQGRCRGRPSHLYIHFLAQSPYDSVNPGVYAMNCTGVLRSLASALHDVAHLETRRHDVSMMALALVHTALCHVPGAAIRSQPTDARIVSAITVMEQNHVTPLPNAALARHVGMSTNAFIRLFHEIMHISPQRFYTRKRIERACMQLHYSDLKLEQIAQQTGFCDRYHFTRTFKRFRGIGPAAFRRQRAGQTITQTA